MIAAIFFAFFLIATLYSSAGFGGGSLYLAILSGSLFSLNLPPEQFKFIALACNGCVAWLGFIAFAKSDFNSKPWKRIFYILACSSPFAFLAASLKIVESYFLFILGIGLIIAAIALVIPVIFKMPNYEIKNGWLFPISAMVGFLSGITGIGGGVYLAPILHFTSFQKNKNIPLVTTVFIAVNSTVAILASPNQIANTASWMYMLIPIVLLGGFLGNYLLRIKMNLSHLKIVTAFVLIFAGVRLIIR
ncbi:MAG: TSUP family transporter [Bacteroidota bacterium]